MSDKIIVILEQRENLIKKASFESVAAAVKLAETLNLETEAVTAGDAIDNLADVSKFGIQKITHFKNSELKNYSPSAYTKIFTEYIKESNPGYVILANTSFGKDLAPRIAARLDCGCLMDCVEIQANDGKVVATRPVYAGKALFQASLNSKLKIFTNRPNVFKAVIVDQPAQPAINVIEIASPDLSTKVIEFKKSEGKLDVAEADIIVSGGRGLKGPENFHLIEELAGALGGAVGASRAVVDAGWRPHREQVGQTGKTVSPTLYVACGISGAIQHLAGMSSAKYIVAINKDKDAPIFSVADYGIAGDIFEIIPALTQEVKKIKS